MNYNRDQKLYISSENGNKYKPWEIEVYLSDLAANIKNDILNNFQLDAKNFYNEREVLYGRTIDPGKKPVPEDGFYLTENKRGNKVIMSSFPDLGIHTRRIPLITQLAAENYFNGFKDIMFNMSFGQDKEKPSKTLFIEIDSNYKIVDFDVRPTIFHNLSKLDNQQALGIIKNDLNGNFQLSQLNDIVNGVMRVKLGSDSMEGDSKRSDSEQGNSIEMVRKLMLLTQMLLGEYLSVNGADYISSIKHGGKQNYEASSYLSNSRSSGYFRTGRCEFKAKPAGIINQAQLDAVIEKKKLPFDQKQIQEIAKFFNAAVRKRNDRNEVYGLIKIGVPSERIIRMMDLGIDANDPQAIQSANLKSHEEIVSAIAQKTIPDEYYNDFKYRAEYSNLEAIDLYPVIFAVNSNENPKLLEAKKIAVTYLKKYPEILSDFVENISKYFPDIFVGYKKEVHYSLSSEKNLKRSVKHSLVKYNNEISASEFISLAGTSPKNRSLRKLVSDICYDTAVEFERESFSNGKLRDIRNLNVYFSTNYIKNKYKDLSEDLSKIDKDQLFKSLVKLADKYQWRVIETEMCSEESKVSKLTVKGEGFETGLVAISNKNNCDKSQYCGQIFDQLKKIVMFMDKHNYLTRNARLR